MLLVVVGFINGPRFTFGGVFLFKGDDLLFSCTINLKLSFSNIF